MTKPRGPRRTPRTPASAARAAGPLSTRSYLRDRALQRLGFEDYEAYIGSPQWRRVKRAYRASDLPQRCFLCATTERIELHHRTYERVGRELLTDLIPLCAECHALAHDLEDRGLLAGLDADDLAALVDEARALSNREQMRVRAHEAELQSPDELAQQVKVRIRRVARAVKLRHGRPAANQVRALQERLAAGEDVRPALDVIEQELRDDGWTSADLRPRAIDARHARRLV